MRCRMRAVVVYYSRTGNTRQVAEAVARSLHTEALPLRLPGKGRRNKADLAQEKALWTHCIREVQDAGIVFIGTPTEFRRPHPAVVKFIVEACQPDGAGNGSQPIRVERGEV